MTRLTNYAAIWLSVATIILYFALFSLTGRDSSKFAADLLVLSGSAFIMASVWPAMSQAVRRGANSGSDRFLVSYWLIWTFVFFQRVWVIWISLMDRPSWMIDSPTSGFIATMIAIAAGYGAIAPLSGNVQLPRQEALIMAIAAGVSIFVAGLAIGVYVIAGQLPP